MLMQAPREFVAGDALDWPKCCAADLSWRGSVRASGRATRTFAPTAAARGSGLDARHRQGFLPQYETPGYSCHRARKPLAWRRVACRMT